MTGSARLQGGDVEFAYETFGAATDPPLLLIAGLSAQLVIWSSDFCQDLAEHGFHQTKL